MAPEDAEESDKDDVFATRTTFSQSTTSFMDRNLNLGKATKEKLKTKATKATSHYNLKDHVGRAATAQAYGDEPEERKEKERRRGHLTSGFYLQLSYLSGRASINDLYS